MKNFCVIIAFILINISSESTPILQKGKNITINSGSNIIFFSAKDFYDEAKIYFEFITTSFNGQAEIYYLFLDVIPESLLDLDFSNSDFSESDDSETIAGGKNKYYFTIIKKRSLLGNLNGTYLALSFECNSEVTIINTKGKGTISKEDSYILQQYGEKKVNGADGGVLMDSSGFKKNDEIYIKIRARYFYDRYLYYEFVDNLATYHPSPYFEDYFYEVSNKLTIEGRYETRYYTIKKDSYHLEGLQGKYLALYFDYNFDCNFDCNFVHYSLH